jgi:hypothetical protein
MNQSAWKEWLTNPTTNDFPHKIACAKIDTWLSWELIPLHLEFVPFPKELRITGFISQTLVFRKIYYNIPLGLSPQAYPFFLAS